jgi:hypothetical protein
MKKSLKIKIPEHVVDHYNEIQSEIARITKVPFYYRLCANGKYVKTNMIHRKYTIGVDWSPKESKGSIVISYTDGITTVIESTNQIASQSKYDFDRIINVLSKEYKSITLEEV